MHVSAHSCVDVSLSFSLLAVIRGEESHGGAKGKESCLPDWLHAETRTRVKVPSVFTPSFSRSFFFFFSICFEKVYTGWRESIGFHGDYHWSVFPLSLPLPLFIPPFERENRRSLLPGNWNCIAKVICGACNAIVINSSRSGCRGIQLERKSMKLILNEWTAAVNSRNTALLYRRFIGEFSWILLYAPRGSRRFAASLLAGRN